MSVYKTIGKRLLDFLLSLIALVLFSPIILIVAILVKVKLGGPVIFKQPRPGKNEKIFNLLKFRSMTDERDGSGNLLSDDIRLTKFGITLRSTSLDELPSLINILKGDMSVVGPRPLLVSYLPLYNEFQKQRHKVRPGLTGLAQVNGRNATTWEQRFKYDIDYIENISFLNDIKIIFKTVGKVFKREGINSSDSSTMKPFTGHKSEYMNE